MIVVLKEKKQKGDAGYALRSQRSDVRRQRERERERESNESGWAVARNMT